MYSVNRSALVLHSAAEMFALVNDIDAYAEFLPWCGGSKVLEAGETEIVATLMIVFKGIRKTFTTRNRLYPHRQITLTLVDGPFSDLSGAWRFTELRAGASKIELNLEFGFANKLTEKIVGPVFHVIADSMVDSFCQRADQIYADADS